jgi:hypothetical protein
VRRRLMKVRERRPRVLGGMERVCRLGLRRSGGLHMAFRV